MIFIVIPSASNLGLLLSIWRESKYHTSIYANEMISIPSSQTFRFGVVIFHLHQPMAFLYLSLYNTPGLAPHMNVLFWRPDSFPVSYANRDTWWNTWNRHSGSFGVDTEILSTNMKSSFHEY